VVLGTPDLLLSLPADTVTPQPAETVYRTSVDPKLKSERWLSALEYQPADRRFVHFAVFRVLETKQWLASWTPWHGFVDLPQGLAYRLPAGSHIAVEIHYYGATQPLTAHGSLGLYFAQQPSTRVLADQTLAATTELQADTNLLALQPQLRAGVQSIEVSARKPDGATQILLFARDLPLQWPTPYVFRTPVALSKGTRLSVIEHDATNLPLPAADLTVTVSGYQGAPLPSASPQVPAPVIAVQHFKLAGTVRSVDAVNRRVVVAHGDIPGYMGAMTMGYAVGRQEDLKKIAAGDRIRSAVVVNDAGPQLENIEVTGR
jgi:Cu/Ag efflux protein CusF